MSFLILYKNNLIKFNASILTLAESCRRCHFDQDLVASSTHWHWSMRRFGAEMKRIIIRLDKVNLIGHFSWQCLHLNYVVVFANTNMVSNSKSHIEIISDTHIIHCDKRGLQNKFSEVFLRVTRGNDVEIFHI